MSIRTWYLASRINNMKMRRKGIIFFSLEVSFVSNTCNLRNKKKESCFKKKNLHNSLKNVWAWLINYIYVTNFNIKIDNKENNGIKAWSYRTRVWSSDKWLGEVQFVVAQQGAKACLCCLHHHKHQY